MRKLLKYNEIPGWLKDNQYITHGYRPVSHSVKASLASIFDSIHNESGGCSIRGICASPDL